MFSYALAFGAPFSGFPSEYYHPVWCEKKLEWCGYPTVKKYLFVLTQCTNVTGTHTDTHIDRHTPHDGIGRAYA